MYKSTVHLTGSLPRNSRQSHETSLQMQNLPGSGDGVGFTFPTVDTHDATGLQSLQVDR